MKTLLIISALAFTFQANAMSIFSHKPGDSLIKNLRKNELAVKFASHITQKSLYDRLTVLTADSLEGRETGKAGAQKASRYIARNFRSFGLTAPVLGSYFFNVPLVEKRFGKAELNMAGTVKNEHDWFYYPTGRASGGATVQSKLFIVALQASTDLLELSLKGIDLSGLSILVLPGNTTNDLQKRTFRSWLRANNRSLSFLFSKQPASILVIDDFPGTQNFTADEVNKRYASKTINFKGEKETTLRNALFVLSRHAVDRLLSSAEPSVRLSGNQAMAKALTLAGLEMDAKLKTGGILSIPVKIDIMVHYTESPVEANDVLGFLAGTDLAEEVLVISAHYDHLGLQHGKIYHGADDDGSGSSALLSIAGAFADAAKQGHKPRRSILFLANVGEEKGLLGSQYYSEHPVFAPAKTITDLNIDMIGRIDSAHMQDSDYVYTIGSGKLSSALQQISESTNNLYSHLKLDYRYDDPNDPNQFYYRSDHYNFAKLNIPIIFYFNGVHADYHQSSDTIEKINFGIYQKRAQLVFYTAWELANRDKRPMVDRTNDFK